MAGAAFGPLFLFAYGGGMDKTLYIVTLSSGGRLVYSTNKIAVDEVGRLYFGNMDVVFAPGTWAFVERLGHEGKKFRGPRLEAVNPQDVMGRHA